MKSRSTQLRRTVNITEVPLGSGRYRYQAKNEAMTVRSSRRLAVGLITAGVVLAPILVVALWLGGCITNAGRRGAGSSVTTATSIYADQVREGPVATPPDDPEKLVVWLFDEERGIAQATDELVRRLEGHLSKERVTELRTLRRIHGTARFLDELDNWLTDIPNSRRLAMNTDKDIEQLRQRWAKLERAIARWAKTQGEAQP